MTDFSSELFVASLAIIGVVVIISALLSGLIERSGLPQVAVFLALGAALGPFGLSLLNISIDSGALRVVAVLSLALVLFTDAVSLNIRNVRLHGGLTFRLLGPGTLLTAALIGLTGWWLLGISVAAAAILGAALASTDPVLLRGLLRRRDIPEDARIPLQLESGLNDVVLLPVVLVALAFLQIGSQSSRDGFARLGLELFILGPGAGVLIGLIGVAALDLIRKKLGVRRDYESLYSLGIAFTAFAAAESVHGSGFLAAFAAGITIAALDVELCDCFVEYGAVTAEMLLLLTFVLLGSSLMWSAFTVINGPILLFTAIAVLIRTPVYLLSLLGTDVNLRGRLLIAWFGPRGLSSLLLILLPVFAGAPGSERLFAICSLVVLVSIVLHGGSPMLLARITRKKALREQNVLNHSSNRSGENVREESLAPAAISAETSQTLPAESSSVDCERAAPTKRQVPPSIGDIGAQMISIDELRHLWQVNESVTVLDVRTERSIEDSREQAKGAIRLPPDSVVERAEDIGLQKDIWLVAYCA
jgi:sodium/hydrogen antiporter